MGDLVAELTAIFPATSVWRIIVQERAPHPARVPAISLDLADCLYISNPGRVHTL